MSNIITAVFQTTNATKTRPLYKYNYGQILQFSGIELPATYEVHLCNVGDSETKSAIGTAEGVEIYDEYLRTGRDINAYIMLHAEMDSGETEYKVTIPVKYRPVPGDAPPTPEQEDVIGQTIAALNEGVSRSETAADNAEQSEQNTAEYARLAKASEDNAKTSEDNAKASEDNAAQSAESSERSALNAAESERKAKDYASDAKASKDDAETAADRAEQVASTAGYMFFHIDENGHLIYERTANTPVDFYLENGHLYVEAIA